MPTQEVYTDLEVKISPLEEIKELVKSIPNDADLGKAVKEFINKYYLN